MGRASHYRARCGQALGKLALLELDGELALLELVASELTSLELAIGELKVSSG